MPSQNLTVRLIDAQEFRNQSLDQQEFGAWATHLDYPKVIPDGEIWIDQNASDVDKRYYLINAYAEREALAAGKSEDEATDYALAVERSERERETRGGDGARPLHEEIPQDVYVEKLESVEQEGETLDVWIVDGEVVRSFYKSDFTEGGNSFVYPWMPENELWIEQAVEPSERPYIILHEATERKLLKDERLGYDDAHNQASKVEFAERQKRKSLGQLSPEMQRAKNVDLIRTTQSVKTCANCMFIDNGYCKHPEVDQQIADPENECCGKWDVPGTERVWELSEKRIQIPYSDASFSAEKLDTKALSAFSETTGGALVSPTPRVRKSLLFDPAGRKARKELHKEGRGESRVRTSQPPTTEENLEAIRNRGQHWADELIGEAFTGVEMERRDRRKTLRDRYRAKSNNYFSECPRDDAGHCKPQSTGDAASGGATEPNPKGGSRATEKQIRLARHEEDRSRRRKQRKQQRAIEDKYEQMREEYDAKREEEAEDLGEKLSEEKLEASYHRMAEEDKQFYADLDAKEQGELKELWAKQNAEDAAMESARQREDAERLGPPLDPPAEATPWLTGRGRLPHSTLKPVHITPLRDRPGGLPVPPQADQSSLKQHSRQS